MAQTEHDADETAAVARSFPGVRVLRQTGRGPAAARTRGARAARGEIVVFTDADCEPTEEWLAALLEPFVDPSVVGTKATPVPSAEDVDLSYRLAAAGHVMRFAPSASVEGRPPRSGGRRRSCSWHGARSRPPASRREGSGSFVRRGSASAASVASTHDNHSYVDSREEGPC